MGKKAPTYFETIKLEARQRWEQLETYPDLAAPWHQLFRQIQSPRHVISELLQNADDVGATWASVTVDGDYFIFQHNGIDFDENNFRSLCRFGYSNKRTLHTIGFRGIGFKSTFSLGSIVEVFSPTLSICFKKNRFTEPIWSERDLQTDRGITTVQVRVKNPEVIEFLNDNIQKWVEIPLPLLFFKCIANLSFNGQKISKVLLSEGPVANSKWLSLVSNEESRLLLVSSPESLVPEEALNEIREERGEFEFDVPPCRVDLIIGLEKQQLYEILPTNVTLQLPFSANAPFIQDPARTGIKEPLRSPMNRWLLQRIGKLAFSTFSDWLANLKLNTEERAKAYSILPKNLEDYPNSVSGYCEKAISDIFREQIRDKPILLTTGGRLASAGTCLNIDPDLLDVWPDEQLIEIFGSKHNSIIAREVNSFARRLLSQWGLIEQRTHSSNLDRFIQDPKPPSPVLDGIKALWTYVSIHLPNWPDCYWHKKDLRIVPVKGKKVLYPANSVNVLGSKEKQLTDEEFAFLQEHLVVLEPEWLRFIQKLQQGIKEQNQAVDKTSLGINSLFSELGLGQGITIESILKQASQAIFSRADPGQHGIRIAHIASRLGIAVSDGFKYVCQKREWLDVSTGVLLRGDGFLDVLYPNEILDIHLLSDQYEQGLDLETLDKWRNWIQSEKSQLRRFLLPRQMNYHIYGKQQVIDFCTQRNSNPPTDYPIKQATFYVTDYDFPEELWQHWESLAGSEPSIWEYLVYQIAQDWQNEWDSCCSAKIQQEGYSYYHNLNHGRLPATWLEKLKKLKCVPDTYSMPRFPSELLRSTPETSALIRIEPFVEPDFDQPTFSSFLDLLGVRNKATDPTKIVNRIRSLSQVPINSVILQEIVNLYDALDRITLRMESDQVNAIKDVFASDRLILSGDSTWHTSALIYQANPDQIPGIPSIYPVSANLNLWERLEIAKRPSIDDAINWLNHLPILALTGKDRERVKAILQRFPDRVWLECKHWLNLENEWQPYQELSWGTEKPSQGYYLFSWVKKGTADLSMLENPSLIFQLGEVTQLDVAIEYRLSNYQMSRYKPNPEWISALSEQLQHVKALKENGFGISNNLNLRNIKENAKRLSETRWMYVSTLNVTPYIGGQPAGYHSRVKSLWHGYFLYVLDDHKNNHREIANAVSIAFNDAPIKTAINDCIGRDPDWIESYFSDYFELGEPVLSVDPNQAKDSNDSKDRNDGGINTGADALPDDKTGEEIERNPGDQDNEDDEDGDLEIRKKRKKALRPEEKFYLFIQSDQFAWDSSSKVFVDKKGNRILWVEGVFPWVEYDAYGHELCRFRIEEGSLETGIIILAEVWEVMKQMPDICCLVIHDETKYRKIFWKDLDQLINEKRLIISTATYLVKQINDDNKLDFLNI